jgi:hypothetical protein
MSVRKRKWVTTKGEEKEAWPWDSRNLHLSKRLARWHMDQELFRSKPR